MVVSMNKGSRRKGFETLGEAASRLLRRLDEKAKRPSGERPEEITNPADVPRKLGHGASEESAVGFGAHHPRKLPEGQTGEKATEERGEGTQFPRPTAATLGGDGRGGFKLYAMNDNRAGRVGSKAWVKSRCAGPRSSADSNLDKFTGPGSFQKTDTARWVK